MHSYTYDAEERITTVDGTTHYEYDAEGERVAEGPPGQSPTIDFLYDLNGRLVTTVGSDFKMVRTNLYAANMPWADYTVGTGSGGGSTEYRHTDGVGTLISDGDQNGNQVMGCAGGAFGEVLQCTPSSDYSEDHFVDKKRDQESNLDYFGARYYSSSLGRFMSPDDGSDQDLTNPQSLNLYSYVQNNPLTNTDPDGHTCQTNSTDGATYDDGDGQGCATVDQQDAERLKNGQYDATVNGTSSSIGIVASNVGSVISNVASNSMNFMSQVGSHLSNIAQTPGGIGCMATLAGSGGMAGAGVGGGVGLVGLAGGGVGVLVTEPAGLAIGGVGGAASGLALGMTVCPGGALAMSNSGAGFAGNQRENKQANDAKQQAERDTGKKFDRALDRKFHDEITGQGYGYHKLVDIAKAVLQGHI